MTPRVRVLGWVVLGALAMLAVRLTHLQVLRGAYYRTLADHNRLRVVPEAAPRGLIVDRRGRVLADSQRVFQAAVVPQDVEDGDALFRRLGALLERSPASLMRAYERARWLLFVPATVASPVPKALALRLEEERWQLPGLVVKADSVRRYPMGKVAAHLLGYLSEPTPEELDRLKTYGVRPKQLVGRAGVERLYDDALRGRAGGTVVEVNHRGRQMRLVGEQPPVPGQRVELTVDAGLQSLIEEAFAGQPGAAAVVEPATGAVLALVSSPAYPPEAFAVRDGGMITQLLNDRSRPLVNRATYGAYQPGSIAKLVTAGAGLEDGLITPGTRILCAGGIQFGDRVIHCWNHDGHGPLVLSEAILHSCNVYFMQLGRWLGRDRLVTGFAQAGFGQPTDWVLEEVSGHLPSRRMTEGEVAMLGIGQGEISVTVIQAALFVAGLANGGELVRPWVVRRVGEQSSASRAVRRRIGWSPATLEALRRGMRAAVTHPEGTAHRAYTPAVAVAGKTGTAQTHVEGKTHAWFIGMCPADHPRTALAVLAEFGGSGGDLPTAIARAICEYLDIDSDAEGASTG